MVGTKRPRFDTRITRLFSIDVPIIQGAMAWLSEAELVAAVSNAGGLGVLATSIMSVDELEEQVVRTKERTDRTFGVNFPLVLGDYREHLRMALAHGVEIVFVAAGSPGIMTSEIHEAGAKCIHVVPSLKLAKKVASHGVDAIVLESFEAGGHVSAEGITAITNIRNVARNLVDVPIIAAGGIVDGRGMAAALALGADAVQMGTRFLATEECEPSEIYMKLLLEAEEGDATVFGRCWHAARALRSPALEEVLKIERSTWNAELVERFIGIGRAKKAVRDGNYQDGLFYSGAGAGMIDSVTSVAELFDTILEEYFEAIDRLRSLSP